MGKKKRRHQPARQSHRRHVMPESPPPLRETPRPSFTGYVFGNRLVVLLISIIALLVGHSFFVDTAFEPHALNFFFSVVVLAAIYALAYDRAHLMVTLLLGLPAIACRFLWMAQRTFYLDLAYQIFSILFLTYSAIIILLHVVNVRRVTYNTFCGAICCFLFVGLIWGGLYMVIESVSPGSLYFQESTPATWSSVTYYSFMTLTAVGYGDITPVSPLVQSLAILEAVIGLFFIAVLIARLMGLSLNNGYH